MIDGNKPQYVWKNYRMEFKSKDDEKLYKELKVKKRKISVEEEIEIAINTIKGLMDNGNLFFKDYEGKVSPISYCEVDNGKIFFME